MRTWPSASEVTNWLPSRALFTNTVSGAKGHCPFAPDVGHLLENDVLDVGVWCRVLRGRGWSRDSCSHNEVPYSVLVLPDRCTPLKCGVWWLSSPFQTRGMGSFFPLRPLAVSFPPRFLDSLKEPNFEGGWETPPALVAEEGLASGVSSSGPGFTSSIDQSIVYSFLSFHIKLESIELEMY